MKRTIAVVTTSRADYSHLYWPLKDLAAHPEVDLKLIVLAAHLSPEFGTTVSEIERDGFPIASRIECLLSSDSDVGMAKTLGLAILGLTDALAQIRPDLLLLIADRYEMLAPASVALTLRIPMAHIEGGEISEGAIDDAVRNALTKMAHIHFTSTDTARARVISMGEEPRRVHRAGAPSLDHIRRSKLLTRDELQQRLDLPLTEDITVMAYHPVTLFKDTTTEADAVFTALEDLSGQIIFCYPNADAGGHALMARIRNFCADHYNAHVFVNLPSITYWSLLREATALLGNSSSGIMEAASFGLPVINVGMRQQGRERGINILDAEATVDSIREQLSLSRQPAFRKNLSSMKNIYGDGYAAECIVSVLTATPLEGLLHKRVQPLPVELVPPSMNQQKIPLSSPDVTEVEIEAVAATLRSPQLSLGPRLAEFEATFTHLTGVEHAIAVSSGTTGLHLAMLALGIGAGDEVIVPSFTFIAAANAIRYVGATPIFVDIDSVTLNLSPFAVERAISPHTRAILAVHTFGVPADMSALISLARRHNLALIEDACEALGATIDSQPIGSFGDVAVFAFYPNKQITTGEGGMIVTRDGSLAAHMRSLRNQGRVPSDSWLQHTEMGYNYRLSEIACTLGIGQMRRLASILDRREQIAHLYRQHLCTESSLTLPADEISGSRISWFVYVVRLADAFTQQNRDQVIHDLEQAGIGCGRYFAPIHLQAAYADMPVADGLATTESVAARTIALPFFNRITDSQIVTVCDALKLAIRRIS
jgi:UDP-hydrolysing UDP-N-acetyl-D-glucosamine 2-epimerase